MTPNPKGDPISSKFEIKDALDYKVECGEEEKYVWTLSDDLAKFAKKQLGEDAETRDTCLVKMRVWIKRQPNLSQCRTDNLFLLRFLRARKFNLEKACDNLEKYINMRKSNPHWFTKIDPANPHVEELCKAGFCFVLPNRDSHDRKVLFSYINTIDIKKHTNSDVLRVNMATLETLMEDEENQIRGITYLFYCKDLSIAHCSIWTPADAASLFGSCEKNVGIRHSDINLVRLPFCLWAVLEFVKQLISAKIKSRINLLSSDDKIVKKFGAQSLPPEVGGSGPAMEEMASAWFQVLHKNRENLLKLDKILIETEPDQAAKEAVNEDSNNNNNQTSSGIWSYIPGM